jgi:hypothetical protein
MRARMAIVLLSLGLLCFPSVCLGGGLDWRGHDLESFGLYKGAGLPLAPGIFNSYSFPNGGKQFPAGIPANTVVGIGLVNYYTANTLNDRKGDKVQGTHDLEALVVFPRAIYFLPWQPENGKFRLLTDLILPIATIHANVDLPEPGGGTYPKGAGVGAGGVGDFTWGPIALLVAGIGNDWIQWSSFVDPLILFPTGEYDDNHAFNVGSNVYTFDLVWENWVNFPKIFNYGGLQLHNLFIYTYHSSNTDFKLPSPELVAILGKTSSSYQNGQVILNNFNINVPVLEHLDIGLNLNYIQQITDDKMNGSSISNSKEQAFSLGPNIYFMKGPVSLSYRASFEVYTENRFEGMSNWFILSYTF